MTQGVSVIDSMPGVLQNLRVSPDDISFGALTNYLISFSTANPTQANSMILIQFPDAYDSLAGVTCVPINAA
jgi:hypothetical protein